MSSFVGMGSSAVEVSSWLRGQGFSASEISDLADYDGEDILSLSREDLVELIGEAAGNRLHSLLKQQQQQQLPQRQQPQQPKPPVNVLRNVFHPIHPPSSSPSSSSSSSSSSRSSSFSTTKREEEDDPAKRNNSNTNKRTTIENKRPSVDLKSANVKWVCCFENQRFYPVIGWTSKLLPQDKRYAWSDCYGSAFVGKDSFDASEEDRERQWVSKWGIETGAHTDKQGWMYADQFEFKSERLLLTSDWQKQNKVLSQHFCPENSYVHAHHCTRVPFRVRRRRWMRAMRPGREKLVPQEESRVVECWENQRYYFVGGWSSQMLPQLDPPAYSDEAGLVAVEKSDFDVGIGWVWDGTWRIDKGHADAQGWRYASLWSSSVFSPQPSPVSIVRRRRWYRRQKHQTDAE